MLMFGALTYFAKQDRDGIKNKTLFPQGERGEKKLYVHTTRNLDALRIDPPGIIGT